MLNYQRVIHGDFTMKNCDFYDLYPLVIQDIHTYTFGGLVYGWGFHIHQPSKTSEFNYCIP